MGTFQHRDTPVFILSTLERLTDDRDEFNLRNQDIQENIFLNLQENDIAGLYLTPLRFDLFGQKRHWDDVIDRIHYSQSRCRKAQ